MNQERRRIPIKLESLRITPVSRDGFPKRQLVVGESLDSGSDTLVQVAKIDRETGSCVPLMEGEVIAVDPEYANFDFIDGVSREGQIVFDEGKSGGWVKLVPPFRESETQ